MTDPSITSTSTVSTTCVLSKKHVKYFQRCMDILPSYCQSLDTSRMTLLYFCLSGLDLLDELDFTEEKRMNIIDWIYAQQIVPDSLNGNESFYQHCGFRGSSFLGMPYRRISNKPYSNWPYDCSHIAMTYTALACLLIIGDDLNNVNKSAVLSGVKALQQPNGSFCFNLEGTETDMRFVYCACAISYILNDWSGINKEKTVTYIRNSMGYDFAFGQGPGLESHGGSTFCAVASLALMDRLSALSDKEQYNLAKWCIRRQLFGFQGRPNKPSDTCYSFWIGATLQILNYGHLYDKKMNSQYIFSTEGKFTGGFSKWPDSHPDPLHSYLGLCGLSLSECENVLPVHSPLNISERTIHHFQKLHHN